MTIFFILELCGKLRCISMSQGKALPETLRNSFLTRVAGLQPKGCDAIEKELPTKFLEGIWK